MRYTTLFGLNEEFPPFYARSLLPNCHPQLRWWGRGVTYVTLRAVITHLIGICDAPLPNPIVNVRAGSCSLYSSSNMIQVAARSMGRATIQAMV